MLKMAHLSQHIAKCSTKLSLRHISSSAYLSLNQKWREEKGLAANPNEFGPLTNLPDYTFKDGRPTPLGSNQKKRVMRQHEIAEKIVTLSGELNYAKKRHQRLKSEEAAEKQRIIGSKLKPKGHLLIKKD